MKQLPSKFADAKDSPGYQLWRVSNLWQRSIRRALEPCGLTHVQFVILTVTAKLTENGDPINQNQVAEAAGADKMMTSQVVRTLNDKGLLLRTPDPADKRAVNLTLTDQGYAATFAALKLVEQADAEFFAPLDDQSPRLVHLLNALGSQKQSN